MHYLCEIPNDKEVDGTKVKVYHLTAVYVSKKRNYINYMCDIYL